MTNALDPSVNVNASAGLGPETIARYLQGPPLEMQQFAFFVGTWQCEVRVFPAEGGEPLALRGEWRAEWVHGGRMLADDLSVFLPNGDEVLGWMNLRTWCAETGCWAISAQRALAAATGTITHGHARDGEMHLSFGGSSDAGPTENLVRFHAITDDSFEWIWRTRVRGEAEWRDFAAISARRADGSS